MDANTEAAVCLNCGAELSGPHCRICGQKAQVHRTLRGFLHDLLHGVFHFEGKVWRTLGMLAMRPGELTRRYIAGERARFVSPVALFLFSVFMMFAAYQLRPAWEPAPRAADVTVTDEGDRVVISDGTGGSFSIERAGWSFWDRGVEKMASDPALMTYKLQANAYKFSWLLIPMFVPVVWLLFAWRRRFGPFDHAVFVTYSLAFMTLYWVVIRLLMDFGLAQVIVLAIAVAAIPLLHLFRQLKGAYSLSWLGASWRTTALAIVIPIVLIMFLNAMFLIGAVG